MISCIMSGLSDEQKKFLHWQPPNHIAISHTLRSNIAAIHTAFISAGTLWFIIEKAKLLI